MPYTKTNWVAGDTVTSEKLNKIENQLETLNNNSGALIIHWSRDDNGRYGLVLDKTYSEISTAMRAGQPAIIATSYISSIFGEGDFTDGALPILGIYCQGGSYQVQTAVYWFYADNVNDYPFANMD